MPLELNYYYGNEAEQYSFYRIPKVLFTDEQFRGVSTEAKVLYGLMLDRMGLSVKNGWMDENRRVYIIYTVGEIMETLGCAEQKATKLLNELDSKNGIGLIERKRRGLGKPNVIFVKNFIAKSQIQNCENHKSGDVKITSQELRKSQTNNTELNNTDFNDTDSINPTPTPSEQQPVENFTMGSDSMEIYEEIIKENIEYEILLESNQYDKELIDGIVTLMVETVCSTRPSITIAKENMSQSVVKSRLLKLDESHVQYVLDCFKSNTTKVRNVRSYLLTALYRAPTTIDAHYAALVSHDMYGGG